MKRVFILSAFLVCVPALSYAATYKPGSVGYLYESCGEALKNSESVEAFDATYCGGFIEGYTVGVAANAKILPPPAAADPCKAEKEKEYAKINGRFCAHLPGYQSMSLSDIKSIAPTAAGIFFRWIEFLKKEGGKKDLLKLPAVTQINAMIGEGNFCDALGEKKAGEKESFEMNPALKNFNLLEYIDMQRRKTLMEKYQGCKADYDGSNIKTNPFKATRCGAEITGFIAGMLSTHHLQEKRSKSEDACEKQINRLYNDLDASETMCVTKDTNPASAAKIFLTRVPEIQKEQNPETMPGYGAVGWQAIYYGFLCKARGK